MARKKITWTEEERIAVANEWATLRLDNPLATPGTILNKAQNKILPQNRKRKVNLSIDKPLRKLCLKQFDELIKTEPKIELPPPPPTPTAMEILDKMDIVELRMYAERRWMETLLSMKVTSVQSNGAAQTTKQQETVISPPVKPALPPAKFKVAVVGVMNGEADEIRHKMPMDTDINVVDKSRGIHSNVYPVTCHAVIIKKSSADWVKLAEKNFGAENVHYIKGSLNDVISKIIQLRSVWLAQQATKKV